MTDNGNNEKDWASIANAETENKENAPSEAPAQTSESIAGVLEHPSYRALEERLTDMEKQAFENRDRAMRAMSELENTRTRLNREVENAHKFGAEKILRSLLPVIDSLEHALVAAREHGSSSSIEQGIDLTYKMLLDTLGKFAVTQFDPLGEKFDPNRHEAISMQPTDKAEPNSVVMVIQKGYLLHERVVRPARVIIATGITEGA